MAGMGCSQRYALIAVEWARFFVGLSFVLLLFGLQRSAFANSTQFEWHVTGLSQTFATKGLAYAALLGRGGDYAYLDKEEDLSDLSGQWAYYKYSATPQEKIVGAWTYHSGINSFPTEPEAHASAYQNIAENYSSPECPPSLNARTDWYGTVSSWGVTTSEFKDFDDIRVRFPRFSGHRVWVR